MTSSPMASSSARCKTESRLAMTARAIAQTTVTIMSAFAQLDRTSSRAHQGRHGRSSRRWPKAGRREVTADPGRGGRRLFHETRRLAFRRPSSPAQL